MSPWDLNGIVLAHVNRFFHAARPCTASLEDNQLASLVGFTGNLLWAHSSFAGVAPNQEKAMALVGAVAGSAGDQLSLGGGVRMGAAEAAMDELECELLGRMDAIVDLLVRELTEAGLTDAGPATVNAWVWNRLFPGYPWPAGQRELEAAIRVRLG